MVSNAELNTLYILKDERELHRTRTDKDDIEYQFILRWLDNRIWDLEKKSERNTTKSEWR